MKVWGRLVRWTAAGLVVWSSLAAPARGERTITAAALRNWPPQYSLNGAGRPTGFAIDVMNAVARRANVKVRYRIYPTFDAATTALASGEVDVIPNYGISRTRLERFAFTTPVETFAVSVFVRKTSPRLTSLGDLAGHSVAVVRDNVALDVLPRRTSANVQVYDSVHRALFDLLAGRVDGFAYPEPVIRKMAREIGVLDRIRPVTPPLVEVKRAVAVRSDEGALLTELDRAIGSLLRSPEYERIYTRWYGRREPFWTPERVVLVAVLVFLAMAAAFALWRRRSLAVLGGALQARNHAEAERWRAEVRYRHLMQEASDGVVLISIAGEVLDANAAARAMLGYDRSELLRLNASQLVEPESLAKNPPLFETMKPGEKKLIEREFVRKDGSIFPAEISVSRVEDILVSLVRDISDRKRSEKKARQEEERLRHAQKLEAIGRLAGGVAHDFNNLLTAILGSAEMLLGHLPDAGPEREDATDIKKAAEHGRELTRQLLSFSRKQVRQAENLEVDALISDMRRMLERIAGDSVSVGVELRSDASVVIERGQLEQVVLNLVVNARDAQPEGGRVIVRTHVDALDAERAEALGATQGRFVVIEVSDEGRGMDAETRSRIFEPFYTTKPRGKGTGLGLSIVQSVVQQAGGFVQVTSEKGQGTTIRILLPAVAPAPSRKLSSSPPATIPQQATGVALVVEDEPSVRRLTARTLRHAGWNVLAAASGQEALDLVHAPDAPHIDILVTDVVMPGMSGPELAEILTTEHPELPVLFTSGYTDQYLDGAILDRSDRAFLPKPFRPDELVDEVARLAAVAEAEDNVASER